VVPGRLAVPASGLTVLSEPPHAHVVCRVCGRIADVPLDTNDALVLEQMAGRRPDGWSVELIAFSLTGACARCREGPPTPR
jgi:Fe2+ or Zn2+ uptake regulation protein